MSVNESGYKSMITTLWDKQAQRAKDNVSHLDAELNKTIKKIENLMDRVVDADSPTIIKSYEKRIQKLEADKALIIEKQADSTKPAIPLEVISRTAFGFLQNPVKLWESGKLTHQKMVLKLTFVSQLSYSRNDGFRTAQPSLPFQLIQGLKGDLEGKKTLESFMVRFDGDKSNQLIDELIRWYDHLKYQK